MPIPHESKFEKIYLEGELVGYDLITEFPTTSLSSIIPVRKGIHHPNFSQAIDDHMEIMNLRLLTMKNNIMKRHEKMIYSILVDESVKEMITDGKQRRDEFTDKYRNNSFIANKINDTSKKLLKEFENDEIATRIIRKFISTLTVEDVKNEPGETQVDTENNNDDELSELEEDPDEED